MSYSRNGDSCFVKRSRALRELNPDDIAARAMIWVKDRARTGWVGRSGNLGASFFLNTSPFPP